MKNYKCSICEQWCLAYDHEAYELEDGSYAYMCDSCVNCSVRTAFCSTCLCPRNLILVYKFGNFTVYGCEKHFVDLFVFHNKTNNG